MVWFYSILGLFMCGPVLGAMVFVLLWVVIVLPLELFIGVPGWVFWPLGILATIITIMLVIGIAIDRVEKDMLHKAEVKRAKDTLND